MKTANKTAHPTKTSAAPALKEPLKDVLARYGRYALGKEWGDFSGGDWFRALSLAVREPAVDAMLETEKRYEARGAKRVYYFSMEFLMGRLLRNNLSNLGLEESVTRDLDALGVRLDDVCAEEEDAALGNGGLGRLAACFLDSMATLGVPGYGYGINYEFGLFKQSIDNGYQRERPDAWRARGTPWTLEQLDEAVLIPVYGKVVPGLDRDGHYNPTWLEWKLIVGVPQDVPIVGYGGRTVNRLRLFTAAASDDFDMEIFNTGDYLKAVEQKMSTESISKVLYPSDAVPAGKELRLLQEYFFVACGLRDLVRRYLKSHSDFSAFADQVAVQMNDTHPALVVAELMRMLVDDHALPWKEAWDLTRASCGYTNHTLMAEALEKWPVDLMERVLPRHLQIVYEINARFLREVAARWPSDDARLARMSIIEEGDGKRVRMAHLAIVGSHSVNGVAALHSELVKHRLVPDFHELWPERFNNKTNGVTPRRWLLQANPLLSALLTEAVGPSWPADLTRLKGLEPLAGDAAFQRRFLDIKTANKDALSRIIRDELRLSVDPAAMFDVQVKRIHEYKRQLLNVLHVVHDYLGIVEDGREPVCPKTYLFAGKAAPGYHMAKLIIKLINGVAATVNADPRTKGRLRVAFLPDYRVSLAERIFPASDLSEQISTAGTEASGTGNMKFAMNGALTIGTLDGANVEIREEVGEANIFIFGLKTEEVHQLLASGAYRPAEVCARSAAVRRVMDALGSDRFCPGEPGLYKPLHDKLLSPGEIYCHLADLESYCAAQDEASRAYLDRGGWARKAVLNVARMGKFSSDRTIDEYAREIWGAAPVL